MPRKYHKINLQTYPRYHEDKKTESLHSQDYQPSLSSSAMIVKLERILSNSWLNNDQTKKANK